MVIIFIVWIILVKPRNWGVIMGILDRLLKTKCCICGIKADYDEVMFLERERGIYGDTEHYTYHQSCLEKVLSDPEKYGSPILDKAVHIVDLIEENRRYLKQKQEHIPKMIKKLKSFQL